MIRENIPDEVQHFIVAYLPSVPHLEALLLLRGNTLKPWDGKAVAQRLYIDERRGVELLADLHGSGLLARSADHTSLYYYAPRDQKIRRLIDRLADTYAKNLVGVSQLIHATLGIRDKYASDSFNRFKTT